MCLGTNSSPKYIAGSHFRLLEDLQRVHRKACSRNRIRFRRCTRTPRRAKQSTLLLNNIYDVNTLSHCCFLYGSWWAAERITYITTSKFTATMPHTASPRITVILDNLRVHTGVLFRTNYLAYLYASKPLKSPQLPCPFRVGLSNVYQSAYIAPH